VREASYPPYGEAFQRKPRADFVNLFVEQSYDAERDFSESINDCCAAVRQRVKNGGQTWVPNATGGPPLRARRPRPPGPARQDAPPVSPEPR
jgi:hypothetical protein